MRTAVTTAVFRVQPVPATATGKPGRGNDFAIIISPEFSPFKGLDIKPLYSLLLR